MIKAIYLVTFMRIYNQGSPTFDRRTTTEDYDNSFGGDRSPTFDRDQEESIRPVGFGSSATDRPSGRFTYGWDRTDATRSSYLGRHTTERSGSPYDRSRDRDSSSNSDRDSGSTYDRYPSRRPSYATDKWGDPIGGSPTRSGYVTMYTTESWRDRDFGSGGRTTARSRWGSDDTTRSWSSGAGSSDRGRFDRQEAYLRIEFELVKLTNEKGLTIDGSKCDTFGSCDPICFAYIDTERPLVEFPGSRTDLKLFTKVSETDDNNSPSFSRANITKEVCGDPFTIATARVYCEDEDSTTKNDMINKWDCPINKETDFSESLAVWTTGECRSKTQADKMKLSYRYKLYSIPRSRCDPRVGGLPASATSSNRPRA